MTRSLYLVFFRLATAGFFRVALRRRGRGQNLDLLLRRGTFQTLIDLLLCRRLALNHRR